MSESKPARPPKKRRRLRKLLIIVGVLIAIRIALPYILLHVINNRLAELPGYYGHVEDLDLALIRGAYQLEQFDIQQVDSISGDTTPFLAAGVIDLSVEWKALFDGEIVGELVIDTAEVRFTKDAVEPAAVQEDTATFRDLLDDLMPIRVNRVEVHEGVLRYKDLGSQPPVDVQMDQIELLATNLRNSYDSAAVLPSTLRVDANIYGGDMNLNLRLNPLAEQPTFDLNADMEAMELKQVNDFMKAYGNFDVNRGTFGLYTEVAAKGGSFTGYVKPLIKDLDVVGPEDRKDTFFRKLWEGTVGVGGAVLRNPREDQVATKVQFEGKLDGPRTNVLYAIVDLLRNAFIRALEPSVDHQISLNSVNTEEEKEGFFNRLFAKDGGKNDDKDRKKKD